MQDVKKSRRRMPYRRHFTTDFRDGTRGLSFAAIGLYSLIIDLLWEHGGRIAAGDKAVAKMLGNRPWRSVTNPLAELIARGKIVVVDDRIMNARVSRDLAESDDGTSEHGLRVDSENTPSVLREHSECSSSAHQKNATKSKAVFPILELSPEPEEERERNLSLSPEFEQHRQRGVEEFRRRLKEMDAQ